METERHKLEEQLRAIWLTFKLPTRPELKIKDEVAYFVQLGVLTLQSSTSIARTSREHLDLKRGRWLIPRPNGVSREIPLLPASVALFQNLIDLRQDQNSDLIFQYRRNRALSTPAPILARKFTRLVKPICGPNYSFPDVRLSGRFLMIYSGVPVRLVNRILGIEGAYHLKEEEPSTRDNRLDDDRSTFLRWEAILYEILHSEEP